MGAAVIHRVTEFGIVVGNRRRCCGSCMGSMEPGGLSSGLAIVLGVRKAEMLLEGRQRGSGVILVAPLYNLVMVHSSFLESNEGCFDCCGIADCIAVVVRSEVLSVLDAAPEGFDLVFWVPWFGELLTVGF